MWPGEGLSPIAADGQTLRLGHFRGQGSRMKHSTLETGLVFLVGVLAACTLFSEAAAATARIVSLDQCADQYVLALAPRESVVGLSHRADDPDSRLRMLATGLPAIRVTAESLLATRPEIAVRYWGGDARLERTLQARGVRVVQIRDAADFAGIRRNIRVVAGALSATARGEALIRQMNTQLDYASGAWDGRSALYLTPSGFTAGDDTLIGAIMRAAGLRNAARRPGYSAAPLESLVLSPPQGFVLGFFDQLSAAFERWGVGRHAALKRHFPDRQIAALPGSVLSCPAWFAGDGVEMLAQSAQR